MNDINIINIYRIMSVDSIYEVFKSNVIGTGTNSIVYLGRKLNTNESVAIKKINISRLSISGFQMLVGEIEIIKEIMKYKNDNILKYYDVIENNDVIYIITEYCENGDFTHILTGKPIKQKIVKFYLKQLINAMMFLKNKHIMHRDIKPSNILVFNDEKTLKICDFGFAKHYDNSEKNITMCGSPMYMAPEIYKKIGYSDSIDVWSLGMIFYEMLFGLHPLSDFNDITKISDSLLSDDPINIPQYPLIDNKCCNLLKRMLDTNFETRIKLDDVAIHSWIADDDVDFTEIVYEEKDIGVVVNVSSYDSEHIENSCIFQMED